MLVLPKIGPATYILVTLRRPHTIHCVYRHMMIQLKGVHEPGLEEAVEVFKALRRCKHALTLNSSDMYVSEHMQQREEMTVYIHTGTTGLIQ